MPRAAIIVTFDRLPCAGLGCYGNEWIDTPGFDALAAEGLVFENHIARQVHGETALVQRPRLQADWIATLRIRGVQTTLLHEPHSDMVIDHAAFETVCDCGGHDGVNVAAGDLPFARLVQRATAWLTEPSTSDRLLWLSSAGLPDVCQPPEDALDLYVEEFADRDIPWEGLSPEEFGRQPAIRAAYLSLLDHWLGELQRAVLARSEPALLIVLGCEGLIWQPVPRPSPVPGGLESQRTNPPWLLWSNDPAFLPGRSQLLVQISDLPAIVHEWWERLSDFPFPQLPNHAAVATAGPGETVSVRTLSEAVVFTQRPTREVPIEPSDVRCFLKPEDPWDLNDVAGTRPDLVSHAAERLIGGIEISPATVAAAPQTR